MKKDSLKNNFVFQIAYQVLMLFIPLIVAPYLTRVLGSNNLGAYAYVHSVAYYFVLFAMLGISKYGQRLIAQSSNDAILLRKSFWSLFATHTLVSLLAIAFYSFFVFFIVDNNENFYWADFFYVVSALFDITWLFYGLENFRSVVYRNTIVKVLECALIFILVQSIDDTVLYILICSVSILLGQLAMIPIALKNIPPIKVTFPEVIKHVKPLLILSIAVLAVSLYTIFGKTLLGIFAEDAYVAFYEYADRLVKIPLTFIIVVGTVMLPRACNLAYFKKDQEQSKYYEYSIWFVTIISSLTFWIMLVLSEDLVVAYLGDEFLYCGKVVVWLSPVILIIGLGDIVRNQYLIPNHRDKLYTIGVCCNAVINIIISITLLYFLSGPYKILGVVIGTISAELFGTFFQYFVCRDLVSASNVIKPLIVTTIIGIITFLSLYLIKQLLPNGLMYLIVELLFGFAVYVVFFYIYTSKFNQDLKNIILSFVKIKNRK